MRSAYSAERRTAVRARRILIVLGEADIAAVDNWAIPAGLPNRADALRDLIRRGLKIATRGATKRSA